MLFLARKRFESKQNKLPYQLHGSTTFPLAIINIKFSRINLQQQHKIYHSIQYLSRTFYEMRLHKVFIKFYRIHKSLELMLWISVVCSKCTRSIQWYSKILANQDEFYHIGVLHPSKWCLSKRERKNRIQRRNCDLCDISVHLKQCTCFDFTTRTQKNNNQTGNCTHLTFMSTYENYFLIKSIRFYKCCVWPKYESDDRLKIAFDLLANRERFRNTTDADIRYLSTSVYLYEFVIRASVTHIHLAHPFKIRFGIIFRHVRFENWQTFHSISLFYRCTNKCSDFIMHLCVDDKHENKAHWIKCFGLQSQTYDCSTEGRFNE